MITAKCDTCGKELGPVAILDVDTIGNPWYILGPQDATLGLPTRNFSLLVEADNSKHLVACSQECADKQDTERLAQKLSQN